MCANIGMKEVFRVLEAFDGVTIGVLVLAFSSFLIFVISTTVRQKQYEVIFLVAFLFSVFLMISSFFGDLNYGLQKAYLGVLLPITLVVFIANKPDSEENYLTYFMRFGLALSVIAILYKVRMGFFDRSVSFGLLGSIPFGWMTGMAFLATILKKDRGFFEHLLTLFFFSMVLWTGSKGPLLALVIICLLNFNQILGKSISAKFIILIGVSLSIFILSFYVQDIRSVRMFVELLSNPDEYVEGGGKGSIGTRADYLLISQDLFLKNPIVGVGFGGWQSGNLVGHKYPHNIYVELLAETGIVGFFIFVVVLVMAFSKTRLFYLALFGLVTLSFSGDLSYLRYALWPLCMGYLVAKRKDIL